MLTMHYGIMMAWSIPITVGGTYIPHDSMQLRQIFSSYLIGNKSACRRLLLWCPLLALWHYQQPRCCSLTLSHKQKGCQLDSKFIFYPSACLFQHNMQTTLHQLTGNSLTDSPWRQPSAWRRHSRLAWLLQHQ